MLKLRRVVVICAGAVAFGAIAVGCTTIESGRDFDAMKAQPFQKGKTSRGDVIRAMGEPSSTGKNSDGSFIQYQYTTIKGSMGDLLATTGIGTMKSGTTSKHCMFMFDANDRLKDYTCSEGGL